MPGKHTLAEVINHVVTPGANSRCRRASSESNAAAISFSLTMPAPGWSIAELSTDGTELRRASLLGVVMAVKLWFDDTELTLSSAKIASALDGRLDDARTFSYRCGDRQVMDLILRKGAKAAETRMNFDALAPDGKVIIGAEVTLKARLD